MKSAGILTANKLKIIASVAMLMDHFVSVFYGNNELISLIFRGFGRTAAPVFCFFIAQGFIFTSSFNKYLIRLLILAVISHFPYNLAFGYSLSPLAATSIILPLAMGLIALYVCKNEKYHIIVKLAILAVSCAISYRANWSFFAVLWIVGFGLFQGNIKKQIAAFAAVGIFYVLWRFRQFGFFPNENTQWFQLGIFLAIPLLLLYNGKQGKKSLFMTWFFYVFYPLHLLVLYLLKNFTTFSVLLGR